MEVFSKKFAELLAEQKDLLKDANKELERLPEGYLSQILRGGKMTYFCVVNEEGRRVRKSINKKQEMIRALARKKYLETQISVLEQDIRVLEPLLEGYVDPVADEILCRLPGRFQLLPDEFFFPEQQSGSSTNEDAQWAMNYKQSTYKAEKRTKTTSRGQKMRSMAEVTIAEIYYKHNIPFRYDAEITIGRYTFSTDFLGKRPRDGKLFYHEHCGMTGDKKYMDHHKWKMEQYESIGIVPWDNLLVTYNDTDGNIDMKRIESEIVSRFL